MGRYLSCKEIPGTLAGKMQEGDCRISFRAIIDANRLRRGAPEIYLYTLLLTLCFPWNSYVDCFPAPSSPSRTATPSKSCTATIPNASVLMGKDCPEKDQAFGTRAKQATSERILRSFHNHLF